MPRMLCGFCLIALLFSCQRKNLENLSNATVSSTSQDSVWQSLEDHNIDYSWFVAKGKCKIETPYENVSTRVYLRLKRDSVVWMVFKKLNVEAIRLQITPDSFFILNRIDKNYERGALKDIFSQFPIEIDFRQMQDYLVGNVPIPDKSTSSLKSRNDLHQVEASLEKLLVRTFLKGDPLEISELLMADQRNRQLRVSFSKYETDEIGNKVARIRDCSILNEKGELSRFKFSYSQVLVDVPKSIKFSIPKHYEEIIR